MLEASAITLFAFALLFLAVVILFREEIRKVIGFVVIGLALLVVWSLVRDTMVFWLPVVAFMGVVLAYAGRTMRERQRATAPQPGQTPAQLAAIRLKDQWQHGEIDDEAYRQGLRDILGVYPDSASQ